jgi:Fe-S-cluster containining protein
MIKQRHLRQLDAIYDQVPQIECKGHCHASCGPIFMTHLEWRRIEENTPGALQQVTCISCPMLDEQMKRCTIYEIRPMICRLWGVVETMRCPFGCKAERILSLNESYGLSERARRLDKGKQERGTHIDLAEITPELNQALHALAEGRPVTPPPPQSDSPWSDPLPPAAFPDPHTQASPSLASGESAHP